ncbi:ero1-like protein, partial [Teleopsis dalmanni]
MYILQQLPIYVLLTLCLIYWTERTNGYFAAYSEQNTDQNCFCELEGSINDCSCDVDTVDHFNNMKVYPRLKSLLVKNYFRFFKVNLKRECPFWPDDSKCAIRFCQVENCAEQEIPKGLKEHSEHVDKSALFKYTKEAQNVDCSHAEDFNSALGFLDTSISDQSHREFARWAEHDEAEEEFCILDDDESGSQYVDLLLNPERYTGYKGDSAHRIWKSIYHENCFGMNDTKSVPNYIPHIDLRNVCLEQRAFYRIISGLHSSINIHLSAKYLLSESKD